MTITERLRGNGEKRQRRENPAPTAGQAGKPAPVRRRIRPLFLIAGAALVVTGSATAYNLVQNAGSTVSVLVTTADIHKGDKLTDASGALRATTIQIAAGQKTDAYRDAQAKDITGMVAAADLPKGSLLSPESVTDHLTPATGESIVGVSLKPELTPARPFTAGDLVRIVDSGGAAQGANPVRGQDIPGKVLDVRTDSTSQAMVVDVLVKDGSASDAAARAARGTAVLVVDAPGKGS